MFITFYFVIFKIVVDSIFPKLTFIIYVHTHTHICICFPFTVTGIPPRILGLVFPLLEFRQHL